MLEVGPDVIQRAVQLSVRPLSTTQKADKCPTRGSEDKSSVYALIVRGHSEAILSTGRDQL